MSTRDVRSDHRSGLGLPWRRHHVDIELAPLLEAYRKRHRRADTELIEQAYDVAREAHATQVRRSGEPYIGHPLGVAMILAELGLDDVTIAGALLHDAVEDTTVTLSDIEAGFGPAVAAIVDGVTKLDRLQFSSKEDQHAATIRKMLVAMASDIRVLLIKLADRLHNMRTISSLPAEKQRRIAQETIDVYAPLAHRLGIADVKWQLEDLAFEVLHPKRYAEIEQMVKSRAPEREELLQLVLANVRDRLADLHIEAEVSGRPKHYWSIYEKMIVRGREFDEIYDLLGLRVIVESVKDCYGALGSIHALWRPVQGRFKDYIAMPKFNLYQSLHTTVIGPGGKPVEFQIRTREMHRRGEYGVAAHWGYKEQRSPAEDMAWLQQLVDWQQETSDPAEFMASLKIDLDQDEVFVFTPKGDVINLPQGATPVDFSYAIHTEVGHRTIGAKVNGKLVPLDYELRTGDSVDVLTSKAQGEGPSQDWLQFVATPRARNKIRQWFARGRREDALDQGKDLLQRQMRKQNLSFKRLTTEEALEQVAADLKQPDLDALYVAVGEGHVSPQSVVARLSRQLSGSAEEEVTDVPLARPVRIRQPDVAKGVMVKGLGDVWVRLGRCCTPVPGDQIVGFVTRGQGVSVHRADCPNVKTLRREPERMIEVSWAEGKSTSFVVAIQVEALDRTRLLSDIATMLSDQHVNILSANSTTGRDRITRLRFSFELADITHLSSLLASVKRVESVYDAYRVVPS